MKSRIILICFILISGASFGQELILGKKEGPRFTMADREIITTKATTNNTQIITVPFLNDGTETLLFSNKNSSCTCIATEIPTEVLPGQKGEFKIHFTPTRTGGYTETIYIKTNAKEIPQLIGFRAIVSK